MQQESQDTHVGQRSLKTQDRILRVVKIWPECPGGVRLSMVPDKNNN